jgi:hypothetical protein
MFNFINFGPMIVGFPLWESVFFWGLLAVLFIELCYDQGTAAFFTLLVAIGAAYYLGFLTIAFAMEHERDFMWMAIFYVPIGVVWATIKWWFYCWNLAGKVRDHLAMHETNHKERIKNGVNVRATLDEHMRDIRSRLSSTFEELPPKVYNHKSDLIRWMAWWPFSIVASIFSDMLHKLFTAIYNGFARLWQAISNAVFRGVDFENPELPPGTPEAPDARRVG